MRMNRSFLRFEMIFSWAAGAVKSRQFFLLCRWVRGVGK